MFNGWLGFMWIFMDLRDVLGYGHGFMCAITDLPDGIFMDLRV